MEGSCSCSGTLDPSCPCSIALRLREASPDAKVPSLCPHSRRKSCPDLWPAQRREGEVGEQENPSLCPFQRRQGIARPLVQCHAWSLQGVRGRARCPLPCAPRLAAGSQIPGGGNHGVHGSVPTKWRYWLLG